MAINFTNPWVIDELKDYQGLIATFGTSQDALLDIVSGKFNPNGKLPFTIPKSKQAVDENLSDVPGNMKANYALYKFGEGLKY